MWSFSCFNLNTPAGRLTGKESTKSPTCWFLFLPLVPLHHSCSFPWIKTSLKPISFGGLFKSPHPMFTSALYIVPIKLFTCVQGMSKLPSCFLHLIPTRQQVCWEREQDFFLYSRRPGTRNSKSAHQWQNQSIILWACSITPQLLFSRLVHSETR